MQIKAKIRVTEMEILKRERHAYYRGNVISPLGDLIAEKASVNIGLVSSRFVDELNRIAEKLGASKYIGEIDTATMDRVYTFYAELSAGKQDHET